MKSHDLLPHTMSILKNLLKSVRSSRQRYEEYKRMREKSKLNNKKDEQLKILDKEMKDVKSCISDNQNISENLNEDFLTLTDEAEQQKLLLKSKEILSKGNSLKCKAKEKLEYNKRLEDALKVLQVLKSILLKRFFQDCSLFALSEFFFLN